MGKHVESNLTVENISVKRFAMKENVNLVRKLLRKSSFAHAIEKQLLNFWEKKGLHALILFQSVDQSVKNSCLAENTNVRRNVTIMNAIDVKY